MNNQYTYKVYDTITDETILTNATPEEISNAIGIPKNNVSKHANNGALYKGRYSIKKTLIKESEKQLCETDKKIMREWEEVCRVAELIRTGRGKIVRKNGKRYTEVQNV